MGKQPTASFVKTKNGSIFQIIINDDKPGVAYLRTGNKYIQTKILDIKQGLVDGKYSEINEHEHKKWVERDNDYMKTLTTKLMKRIILSQLLIELDEDLVVDYKDDKRMNTLLRRSTKECERVTAKGYDMLYDKNKNLVNGIMVELDEFTTKIARINPEDFVFLNKMADDYLVNPSKFHQGTVKMTQIQE
jgi:hypothetical protein